MKHTHWAWLFLLTLSAWGCGSSGDSTAAASGKEPGAEGSSAAESGVPAPDEVVFDFLSSFRDGDDAKAEAMLTDLAREKTKEIGLAVAPEGTDTASFEVGDVEYLADDLAHVGCKWTDLDESGQSKTDEIVWCLRMEEGQWRIGGMATRLFEGEPPVLLDFEDPEDMLRKQEMAEQEMLRRSGELVEESGAEGDELPADEQMSDDPADRLAEEAPTEEALPEDEAGFASGDEGEDEPADVAERPRRRPRSE